MTKNLACRRQAFNTFQLTTILLIVCMVSVVGFSTAFADGHEVEGEAMEEKPKITGWFQVDVDSLGTYFLVGATHPFGGIALDSNVRFDDTFGEFDIGAPIPILTGSDLSLTLLPKLGVGFNYVSPDGPYALYPQIFAILPAGKIFGFHWTIGTVKTIFDDESLNEVYNRTYLTYALNDTIAVGPQFESVLGLGDGGGLWALNFGGRLNIGYGENNTLGIYVGYETKKGEGETGLTGRMNFTRRW